MRGISDLTLRPVPGHGLVGRLPGLAVLVLGTDARADAVLDACRAAAASDTPAGSLATQLDALGAAPGGLPPYVVVADDGDGIRVLAHDGVEVALATAGAGAELVRTAGPGASLDELITAPATAVRAAAAGATATADPRVTLGAGIVPGSAFTLGPDLAAAGPALVGTAPPSTVPTGSPVTEPTPAAGLEAAPSPSAGEEATAPTPAPAEPAAAATPFASVLLIDAEPDEPERAPLPLAAAVPTPAKARVHGIVCSRGHFNDPEAYYCARCGISLVQQTHNLVEGDRPSLGFLVFDDGATFTLDSDYVVGREPDGDPRVTAGEARPLLLDDDARTVSRVHAEVRLDGWRVDVVDRGSTNGTFVWRQGGGAWERLGPGQPVRLEPGVHASFGQRVFRFESPHDQHHD